MKSTPKKDEKPLEDDPVSLAPLKLEEAIRGLFQVKPPDPDGKDTPKKTTKKKRSKKKASSK